MRQKFAWMLTPLLVFFISFSYAQEKTVSGTVTDQSGLPLPGVSIVEVGTTNGTQTDFDGNYAINVEEGQVLRFSYVGQKTVDRTVGTSNTISIQMEEDAQALEEVVVTALGIQKGARTLGYGTDVVKGEDLVKARESNIVNSLQGKVTGVQITNSGGNLGGSSKIIIRGVSSLSGNNNPLWVVDGVLINDSQTAPSDNDRITGNRDFSNGAAAINPDDVESINVLKGAAATALYGSRAASGAIIVTTKKGRAGDGVAVSFNSSTRFDNLFVTPDYQQEYAAGSNGQYNPGSTNDWGPRIAGQTVDNLAITNQRGALTAVPNNGIDNFFKTGITRINNFSIGDANEKMDYRLSITSLNQTGILPGSSLDRITVGLNAGVKHNEKLESRFSVQYTTTKTEGTGTAGANDPNIVSLASFSSTLDPALFSPWIDEAGNQINLITANDGSLTNNYLWLRNENKNDRDDDRIFGNYQITFKPFNGFSLLARVGVDLQDDRRLITNRVGTVGRLVGDFLSDNIRRNEITSDIIATYNTDLTENLSLSVLGGMQYNARIFERQQIEGVQLLVPELFSPANASQTIPERDFTERRLFGIYGSAELGYKDWATLTLTARNDYSSTLPQDNNSYFYPSASLAFVFSDAFNLSGDFLTFGKLRASWAQVGNDTDPYQVDFLFQPRNTADGQYSLDLSFPFNGSLAYRASPIIPSENLLPEEQTSYEFGLDLKFFNGRLGIDASYFKNQNKNQILNIPIPETTGFAFRTQNVGQVDQTGFEIALTANPLRIGDFSWNTAVNFSRVESEVVSLTQGLERVIIASGFSSVQVVAVPGKEFQLFAFPYLRDEETGRPIIDPNTGRRQAGEATELGSVLPDWTGGWVNNFSYKGFNVSATIDVRWGGIMKSSTVEDLQTQGLVRETTVNREGTFIDREGIIVTDNGDGTVTRRDNDVPVLNAQDFWTSLDDNSLAEPFIFDASYIKFREASISYTFPSKLLGDSFVKGLTIGVEGRNLALLYSKVPHIDPESSLFGSGADGFGIERASIPSTRSIGFNVRLRF
ncbi:SusC/RagA family TonB-linked outer membrane protein [Maribacter sp. 2304DJ31-5]|uniref:SusC/RagA family TonB-linked outer membrane protein n=1 Tax=Maribacter sp. 2304DJ31-5 TaxID=3386273 RepID=UPI0039BD3238